MLFQFNKTPQPVKSVLDLEITTREKIMVYNYLITKNNGLGEDLKLLTDHLIHSVLLRFYSNQFSATEGDTKINKLRLLIGYYPNLRKLDVQIEEPLYFSGEESCNFPRGEGDVTCICVDSVIDSISDVDFKNKLYVITTMFKSKLENYEFFNISPIFGNSWYSLGEEFFGKSKITAQDIYYFDKTLFYKLMKFMNISEDIIYGKYPLDLEELY